ncbi:arabinosyltransferase domain-containing protein [Blastococcus goldschmidtiae]|uniref:Arabinosyltransferase domain-containing protein n=1 Tax=Blastococcus goldschmidtiae TaxID=3075546 RepID=A0ABU2K4L8_9ACTN|nr:arabinosyltransferase domain-containing protein [Blastococcus sp. DSM 46792]MDT0275124.1 arabinosyltransferase domain-containing protein [Blastococcus sp. DSM 46792]
MSSARPAQGRAAHLRLPLILLAALSLLSSVAFVLAPVERPEAVYGWPSAPGDATAVAIPLMLERPVEVRAEWDCAAARAADDGTALLSTTPLDRPPGGAGLAGGLRVAVDGGDLVVRSGGTDLPAQAIPGSGDCSWELTSSAEATTLRLDGEVVADDTGDLRPAVAGVFSDVADPAGLSVAVTADTVFQTSPTPLKYALAVLAVLALAGAVVLVVRRERRTVPAGTDPPAPSAVRPGAGVVRPGVDAVVALGLAVWTFIGPMTVDDGYITGIVRSRDENGFVGNVYRWFNAPEAPFGWHYELLDLWSGISESTLWMRVPSSLLGIATWLLIARGLLPRLGRFAASRSTYAIAAATFALWWLPTNLGLRPEPWVAAGFAAVMVLVEGGLRRGRSAALLLGLVVAGATLAVTPTGAVAFLPFLAAAVPILRLARSSPLGLPALTVAAAASAATALLLVFGDQNLAALGEANRIRSALPGALPWSDEPERWYLLLSNGDLQGSLGRRVPVLLAVLAVLGIVWQRVSARWPHTADSSVAGRLAATFGLSLVVLMATPTKWTMHFSALVPVGTALIVVAVHLFGPRLRAASAGGRIPTAALTRTAVPLALVLLVGAQSWAGLNRYAYLSDLGVPWNDVPPEVLGLSISSMLLILAVLVSAGAAATVIWARARDVEDVRVPLARYLPSPGLVAVGLVVLTVALQLGSFVQSTRARQDTYTLASDAAATLGGEPCGLAEELRVEPDPAAGLLTPATVRGSAGEPVLDGFAAVPDGRAPAGPDLTMAGVALPGWAATGDTDEPARLVTGWFEVPDALREERLPLVVTTSGHRRAGTSVVAEYGRAQDGDVEILRSVRVPDIGGAPAARDGRLDPGAVPPEAELVRLVAEDGGVEGDLPLAVSVPRVPVTVPFRDVVDPGSPALVDWPVAFVFPCQSMAVQQNGLTDVPDWRISPAAPDEAGDIVVQEDLGGPYAPARSLVDQEHVPVYLTGQPLERPVSLYAWEPRIELAEPVRRITTGTVAGWAG